MVQAEEHKLRQYLLCQLAEAEEEQIEVRLLTEPGFAEELDIVVNEITDDYIADKFEGAERKQVEDHFFKSSERRDKLKFALALKERKYDLRADKGRKKSSFGPYLAIAASVLLLAGGGFYIWRVSSSNAELNKGLAALQSAFREERPLEARVSDFSYAPFANQRGGPARVDYVQRDRAARLLLNAATENPNASSHHALGKYYLAERQFDKAIDQFKSALELDPKNAKIYCDMGVALLEEGKMESSDPDKGKELETFARSLEHFRKALELDSSLLEALFNRALVSQYMMPSQQAAAAWREYLQRDASSLWADEARRNLKLLEETSRRTSWNTRDALKSFLEARTAGNDNAAWDVLSQSYTSAGNELTNTLLDSLFEPSATKESTESSDALQALSYVAKLELQRNEDHYTADLVTHYGRATPEIRSLLASARKHMKAGYALFTQSKFSEAIGEYTAAKLSYGKAADPAGTALVDYRLGHCYILLNDLKKAHSALQHLSTTCEASDYRWLFAQCLYGLAHASASANEYSKAIEYSDQALARFERAGDPNGILKCLAQLADVNQSLNRTERSLGYLSRGLALASEIRAEPMQRWGILVQMAFNMSSMQLHEAEIFYDKEALAVALEMGRPLIISRSYGYIGSAYATLKMYPEALNEATKAFETGKSILEAGGLEIMANASLQLGNIRRQAGQCEQAIEAYNKSIQLYGSLHLDYYSYVAHKGKLLCYIAGTDNGAVGEELHTVLGLSELYRSKITAESERTSFFDVEQGVYDLAIQYEFVRMKNPVKAFEYSEASRARSLLDEVRRGTVVLRKSYGPDLKTPTVTIAMSLDEVQRKIPDGAQILQYAVLDDRLLMWVVSRSEIHYQEVGVGAELLGEKVRTYLAAVNTPPKSGTASQPGRGQDLYSVLIAPVEPFLDKSKFLCVVPDKILHYLPYNALISPATNRYLIEDYDIGRAPSSSLFADLSALAERKAGAFDERMVSVGNPRFNRAAFDSLLDLPSAAREAKAVAAFYPRHRLLVGDEAKEAIVRTEIASADVIHLAMHYVKNEHSGMLSGFPLVPGRSTTTGHEDSDGFLQAYEIYMINLRRPRLVVLSACQTGIEQQYGGEGAVSIARPFLVARVPVVVASLWPVDSEASAELMTSFHKHRIRDALPVAKALKQAQIDLARGDDLRFRDPYYWASFQAIGGRSSY